VSPYAPRCENAENGVVSSCFTIATDGTRVRTAKRRAWLEEEEGEGYHDTTAVVASLSDAVKRMHAELGGRFTYVFGELYGGEGEEAVQTEIVYCKHVSFLCFDVAVDGTFVDYARVLELAKRAGLPCLQPLFSGTLAKCLQFNVDFVTTVSALHGEKAVSRAEGVVVKSSVELAVQGAKGGTLRAVSKIKCAKFREVVANYVSISLVLLLRCCNNCLKSATKGREREALEGHVTRARLSNVLSKRGKIKSKRDPKLAAQLAAELLADVLQEAREGSVLLAQYLDKNESDAVAALQPCIARLVAEWAAEK
jgi:Rnl2 family RNA ligase